GSASVANSISSSGISSAVHYNNCGVTLIMRGISYLETLTGGSTFRSTFSGTSETHTVHIGISLSGDLGLAIDCDVSLKITLGSPSSSPTGSCRVFDALGGEISIPLDQADFII